jgi:hypothetical protein
MREYLIAAIFLALCAFCGFLLSLARSISKISDSLKKQFSGSVTTTSAGVDSSLRSLTQIVINANKMRQEMQASLHLIWLEFVQINKEIAEHNRIERLRHGIYDENTQVMKVPEGDQPSSDM